MHVNDVPLHGLTQDEVRARREAGRTNTMPRRADGGLADILRRNVMTLFNLLNLCLAGLLLWVGSHRDMLFLGVVLSNTLIGTVQELRAKRTHDRLQLLSEGQVRVMRDGAECLCLRMILFWTTWSCCPAAIRCLPTPGYCPARPRRMNPC